jgi:hypothetical protein
LTGAAVSVVAGIVAVVPVVVVVAVVVPTVLSGTARVRKYSTILSSSSRVIWELAAKAYW